MMTAKAIFSPIVASLLRAIYLVPMLAAGFVALAPTTARAEAPATYMQRVQNELVAAQRAGSISAFSNVLRTAMFRLLLLKEPNFHNYLPP